MNRTVATICLAALVGLGVGTASAQDRFPSKPITVLVGFAAGGGTDTLARLIGPIVSAKLGQPVIVENMPGASGMLASNRAVKAAPDGHTLVFISSNETVLPAQRDMPYSLEKDLTPVALVAGSEYFLSVNSSLPVTTVGELIALAKAQPGKLNYSSSGAGSVSHLAPALFTAMAGINVTHVPYKGGSEYTLAVATGNVDFSFSTLPAIRSLVEDKKLRILAVSSPSRSALMPQTPTVAEAGVPGYKFDLWYGLLAPAATPRPVVTTLNQSINEAIAASKVQDFLRKQALTDRHGSPEAFAATIAADTKAGVAIVKAAGLERQP